MTSVPGLAKHSGGFLSNKIKFTCKQISGTELISCVSIEAEEYPETHDQHFSTGLFI